MPLFKSGVPRWDAARSAKTLGYTQRFALTSERSERTHSCAEGALTRPKAGIIIILFCAAFRAQRARAATEGSGPARAREPAREKGAKLTGLRAKRVH